MPDEPQAPVNRVDRREGVERWPRRDGSRRRGGRFDLPAFMGPPKKIPRRRAGPRNLSLDAVARPDFPLRYIPGYTLNDQETTLWCWAAMGESIARYYDSSSGWTQCRLANRLRRPGEQGVDCCSGDGSQCSRMRTMDEVFAAIGHLRDPRVGTMSFEDVSREVSQHCPICVRVTPQGQGHFVAITGVERVGGVDWLLVNDPARPDSKVPFEQFHTYYAEALSNWTHTYLTRREGGIRWA